MLDFLISGLCLNLNPSYPNYYEACSKALQATAIQYNIKQESEIMQHKYEHLITDFTGKEVWFMGAVGYTLAYKSEIFVATSGKPISDSISMEVSKSSQLVKLGWTW